MRQKTRTLAQAKKRLLHDAEGQSAYESMALEFEIASAIVEARARANLTQSELAARMGTRQSFIARLESGATLPSMATLRKVAEATGTRPRFAFVAARKAKSNEGQPRP